MAIVKNLKAINKVLLEKEFDVKGFAETISKKMKE